VLIENSRPNGHLVIKGGKTSPTMVTFEEVTLTYDPLRASDCARRRG
jgi:hypothetical protein